MIVSIKGVITKKQKESVFVEDNNLVYEIFLPRTVSERLENLVSEGSECEFVLYHYYQVDQARSIPYLIGFFNTLEKDFFEQFIKVSGIGPKAALKAFDKPISQIAQAIDEADEQFLKTLPGIGQQKARHIIASLQGKVGRFGLIQDSASCQVKEAKKAQSELKEEALSVLKKLQYKRAEALVMIEGALKENAQIQTVEELLNEIYKQRKYVSA